MASVVLCQTPSCTPGFMPYEGHVLNFIFGATATQVSVDIWPIAPATAITTVAVFINGSGPKASTLTPISGGPGQTLRFNLGGDMDEVVNGMNAVFIDIDDNAPGYTPAVFIYHRRNGGGTTTTPAPTTAAPRPPTYPRPPRGKKKRRK